VNSDDIKKHRRDVILLVAARTETEHVSVPVSILKTVNEFKQLVNTEESASALMNSLRIDREQLNVYLEALGEIFIGEEQR
jgi:hypothetical protein